jgi:hypothetical protein
MVSALKERSYFFRSTLELLKHEPNDKKDLGDWVRKLYTDPCVVILQPLVSALPCGVFTSLYSRHYFESSHCGNEWYAIARREITAKAQGDAARSRISRVAQYV